MIRIEVNIDDDQLMDSLAALARQGEDATPIMRGLAGVMRSAAQDAFDMECDPVTGAAWPPLNEAYKKQRYADRYTGKMLNRTGDMRRSLSVRYGKDFALVGVNAPYAFTAATAKSWAARPCATPAASSPRAPSWAWARTTRPRCAG